MKISCYRYSTRYEQKYPLLQIRKHKPLDDKKPLLVENSVGVVGRAITPETEIFCLKPNIGNKNGHACLFRKDQTSEKEAGFGPG